MKSNKQKNTGNNTTIIIAIASLAFIISLFFQLIIGASEWKKNINSQMKIYIYLDDSLDVNNINKLVLKLKQIPYLNKANGKSDIVFKSKNKTANEFILKNNENFEELLGDDNPFKNLLIFGVKDEFKNESEFKILSKNISQIEGVYEVTFPNKYISTLTKKMNEIAYFLLFILSCVCIFVYLQIDNFVKINIYANRILIKSMQLLGSTNSYIRKPYLIDSLLQSLIGGTLGSLLSYLSIYYFSSLIPELKGLINENNVQLLSFGVCILFCSFFSFISTLFSLNSKLRTSISNLI